MLFHVSGLHPQGPHFFFLSPLEFSYCLLLFPQMIEFHFTTLGNIGAGTQVHLVWRTLAPRGADTL